MGLLRILGRPRTVPGSSGAEVPGPRPGRPLTLRKAQIAGQLQREQRGVLPDSTVTW